MPSNAGLLLNILGSFIGDSSLPTPNQNAYTIDENGNIILPYNKPGFGTRLFHPEIAQQEGEANAQAATLRNRQTLADQISTGIAAGKFGKVRGSQGIPLTSPGITDEQGAILTGNNPSAAGMYDVNKIAAGQSAGIPTLAAQNQATSLEEGTRQAQAGLEAGLPESRVGSELASNQYQSELNKANLPMIAPRLGLESAQIDASKNLLPLRTLADAASLQAGMNQSNREVYNSNLLNQIFEKKAQTENILGGVEKAKADTMAANIPAVQSTLRNRLLGEALGSTFPSVPTDYLTPRLDTETGTVSTEKNPLFISPLAKMQALSGTPSLGAKMPDGSPLPLVGHTIDAVTGKAVQNSKPATQTNTEDASFLPVSGGGEQKSGVSLENFLDTLQKGKSDPKKNPNAALKVLTEHLGANYPLPKSIQEREHSKYIGGSSLKWPASSPGKVYYNALVGKDPDLHWSDVMDMIKQLPAEQQNELFSSALKQGGF